MWLLVICLITLNLCFSISRSFLNFSFPLHLYISQENLSQSPWALDLGIYLNKKYTSKAMFDFLAVVFKWLSHSVKRGIWISFNKTIMWIHFNRIALVRVCLFSKFIDFETLKWIHNCHFDWKPANTLRVHNNWPIQMWLYFVQNPFLPLIAGKVYNQMGTITSFC